MSNLSVEDDEMLHNLVEEVMHDQGWSIGARHVRNYHQQCTCDEPNCIEHSKNNYGSRKIILRRKRSLTSVLMRKLMR